MDWIAWAGSRILDGLSYLPYFKGKGLLSLWTVRLLGQSHPLSMRLSNGGRIQVQDDNAGHLLLPYLIGKYERATTQIFLTLLRRLKTGKCVVDIGANVGYYALIAAWHLRPRGEMVYAFEPNPFAFRHLQDNIALNRLTNLVALQQGIASASGQLVLYINPGAVTFGSLQPYLPHLTQAYSISVITLDEFMSQCPNRSVGLMKVDIEGGEFSAFLGAEKTIAQDRPVIIYEENELACRAFGYTPADLRDFLVGMGYQLERIEPVGEGSYNVLALPA